MKQLSQLRRVINVHACDLHVCDVYALDTLAHWFYFSLLERSLAQVTVSGPFDSVTLAWM